MITVRLEGRLGNQLFQYAFIYAAARRLNTSFYIDKSIENFLLPKYFEVSNGFPALLDNGIFSIEGYKNIFSIHLKKSFYHFIESLIFRKKKITIDNETLVKENLKHIQNNCLYQGFFHSEGYFEDFKHDLRKLYQIKKNHVAAFEQVKRKFDPFKKKVVIHIRRGDYVGLNISLPPSYYKKAIEILDNMGLQYIFISDDPAFIEREFEYIPDKYVSSNTEIIDLQFMIDADICILSNSSFSWWGAWLNNNESKQVFAPKYWLGFKEVKEYPVGISDNMNFNWIEV